MNIQAMNNQKNEAIENAEIDSEVLKQFKVILIVMFLILFGSLLFFVYNLIKCYLPKWTRQLEVDDNEKKTLKIKKTLT